MNNEIKDLLLKVKSGEISPEDACLKIKSAPFRDIDFAKIDTHRKMRRGAAEVIYGAGKTDEQIIKIIQVMKENREDKILITRLEKDNAEKISAVCDLTYDPLSKIGYTGALREINAKGKIVVACGGTSDIPVADEAAITARFLGNEVVKLYDVGVSGLHRLLDKIDDIMTARVIIAVAGMEGALASVIAGLADCPVIALPTSVGYGASFEGLSALLSMLNSCSAGVSVVNIDNGFGAGYLASMINHME